MQSRINHCKRTKNHIDVSCQNQLCQCQTSDSYFFHFLWHIKKDFLKEKKFKFKYNVPSFKPFVFDILITLAEGGREGGLDVRPPKNEFLKMCLFNKCNGLWEPLECHSFLISRLNLLSIEHMIKYLSSA